MKNIIFLPAGRLLVFIGLCIASHSLSAQNYSVHIVWDHVLRVSQTTPTLQVVVNPMLRAHSPIHEGSFRALKSLGCCFYLVSAHRNAGNIECSIIVAGGGENGAAVEIFRGDRCSA